MGVIAQTLDHHRLKCRVSAVPSDESNESHGGTVGGHVGDRKLERKQRDAERVDVMRSDGE